MTAGDLARLFRTAWHLRPAQMLWRARYAAGRRWPWPRTARPPADLGADSARLPAVPVFHQPGSGGEDLLDELRRGVFTHLGETRELGYPHPDWRLGDRSEGRLWTVTLHYHGWAHALATAAVSGAPGAHQATELLQHYVSDWIERCDLDRPGARGLAWNSFAIATRIGWWVRTLSLLDRVEPPGWDTFAPRMRRSLWRQADWLERHLEWDLRGNHVLRDLAGLAWAGRLFDDAAARRWMARATVHAVEQVQEQILDDGMHFERSPMYHVHVMEDVLALALLLTDEDAVTTLTAAWRRMADCLVWLVHPDGQVAQLNDAAQHAVCDPERMLAMAPLLGLQAPPSPPAGGRVLSRAGLVVWHGEPWSVFFDVGPLGPDYQPGHGHADSLTFEASYAGRRVFVDPGCFSYDADGRRRYDRSTAAHNTLCLDRRDSSEVWHIFRVGRRARPLAVTTDVRADGFHAAAGHDGYDRLPGRPRHRRTMTLERRGELAIEDLVEGRRPVEVEGGLLVDPGWKVETAEHGWWLRQGAHQLRVSLDGPPEIRLGVERAAYHPRYGVELLADRLHWSYEGPLPFRLGLRVGTA